MEELLRCDFFALAPRPQKIIINLLKVHEIYRISVKSKRWQRKVKETNRTLEHLQLEFGVEPPYTNKINVKVANDDEIILDVHILKYEDDRLEEPPLKIHDIIEYAKHSFARKAVTHQLGIVGERLLNMFEFKNRTIIISPSHSFLQSIYCRFLQQFHGNYFLIQIRTSAIPLSCNQLNFVLHTFKGRELVTGNTTNTETIAKEIKFESLYLWHSNWLSKEALRNLYVKELTMQLQARDAGIPVTWDYIQHFIELWILGYIPNIETFECNLFWDKYELDTARNFLTQISAPFRRPPHLNQNDGFYYVIEAGLSDLNYKCALIQIHLPIEKPSEGTPSKQKPPEQHLIFTTYDPVDQLM